MLETVVETDEGEFDGRKSQEVAPVGQHFVAHLRREGESFVQTLMERDQQVAEDLQVLQQRNEQLEHQVGSLSTEVKDMTRLLGTAQQKFTNVKLHVEDLQATAAAVTARLNKELMKRGDSLQLSELGPDE